MASFAAAVACVLLPGMVLGAQAGLGRPDWVNRAPPQNVGGEAYFVGVNDDAASLEEGKDAAFRDAARQIAAFLQTRVTQEFISRRDRQGATVIDKVAAASAARLAGARIIQTYYERGFRGRWPLRREVLSVWVLVGFPQVEAVKERTRLQGLHQVFQERIADLCDHQAQWLIRRGEQGPIEVKGYRESTTSEVYALSRIVEEGLSACLASRGVPVAKGHGVGVFSTGVYYRAAGGAIVITGVIARADGTKLTAKAVNIPEEALGPAWLEREETPSETLTGEVEEGATPVAARQASATEAEQESAVIEGPILGGNDSIDLFRGWAAWSTEPGGPARGGAFLAHFDAASYVRFFMRQVVGIGGSAVEVYSGPWKVHYQQATPSAIQNFVERPPVFSVFPLHLVIAPLRERWLLGRMIGNPVLSYSFSAWGCLLLRHGPGGDNVPWNVVTHDVGISLPVGHWLALRGGFLSVHQPGFRLSREGLNQQAKPQTTTWIAQGFRHQQWYLGGELHFGGRL